MLKHIWVEMQYMIIDPVLRSDGVIDIFTTEAQLEAGVEQAKQGCWACHIPLSADTIDTGCPGMKGGR